LRRESDSVASVGTWHPARLNHDTKLGARACLWMSELRKGKKEDTTADFRNMLMPVLAAK